MPLRHNYGGILQNYALQRVLKEMGHDVTTLEITKTEGLPLKARIILIFRNLFYRCVDNNGRFLHILSSLTSEQKLSQNTWPFICNYINIKRINGYPKEDEYDAYVVGSDQVWRPKYFDTDIAFLAFTKNYKKTRRLAYAVSFGTDCWEYSDALSVKCSHLAAKFDAVSVREKMGIKLCKDHLHVDAIHVLDPTMLLSKNDYLQGLGIKTSYSGKELFYYFLDENENKRALVERISNCKRWKSYTVNSRVEDSNVPLNERIQPPIEDWIQAFETSSFIVTDSFHGSVFSLLFNKPFIVIGNTERGLSRFTSLMGLFNQEYRVVTENDLNDLELDTYMKQPNVDLNDKRLKSIAFIKKNL